MKAIKITGLFSILTLFCWTGDIHNFSVPRIEGGSQSLSVYQGKKILVITLPLQQTASTDSMLYSLDTLGLAHQSDLAVIAVPSYEDGYTPEQKTVLEQWYRGKLGNYIVVTDGLYTRKTSGSQQHALFKWLTDVSENEVFNIDVEGPGYKFFAKAGGELYGVLRPQTKISGISVQKTLQMQ